MCVLCGFVFVFEIVYFVGIIFDLVLLCFILCDVEVYI